MLVTEGGDVARSDCESKGKTTLPQPTVLTCAIYKHFSWCSCAVMADCVIFGAPKECGAGSEHLTARAENYRRMVTPSHQTARDDRFHARPRRAGQMTETNHHD